MIFGRIRGKNYNKGFSSPNTSYRLLERLLKVVTLGSLGKTQDGPSKIGVIHSYTPIKNIFNYAKEGRRELNSHLKLFRINKFGGTQRSFKSVRPLLFELLGPFLVPCTQAIKLKISLLS